MVSGSLQGNLTGGEIRCEGKAENKGSFLLHNILFVCITPRQWQRGLINEAQNKRALSLRGREMILKACQLQFEKSYNEQTLPALEFSPLRAVYQAVERTDAPWST